MKNLYEDYQNCNDELKRIEYVNKIESKLDLFIPFVKDNYKTINCRSLSYCLALLSKRHKHSVLLSDLLSFNENCILNMLINNIDDKVRKNLYKVLGNLKNEKFANFLIVATKKENSYITLSSLVLAIGNVCPDMKILDEINSKIDKDMPEKFKREIRESIKKVIDKNSAKKEVKFYGFKKEVEILLTTMESQKQILKNNLKGLFDIKRELKEGFVIQTKDLNAVYKIRSFYESYIFNDNLYNQNTDDLINNLFKFLMDIDLLTSHKTKSLRYRVTVLTKNKKDIIGKIVKQFSDNFGDKYINSPSNYNIEIILQDKNCFIKLHTFKDERFCYRKEAVPASINPVTANIVCNLAFDYVTPKKILDCFCGTSTLLIEASKIHPECELFGVDNARDAIQKSRINAKCANVKVNLTKSDILKYKSSPVDMIISNLPFGARVGNHRKNIQLYEDFINMLPKLLSEQGYAFLYTTEKNLITKLVREDQGLTLLSEKKLESGGLFPSLFVIKKS